MTAAVGLRAYRLLPALLALPPLAGTLLTLERFLPHPDVAFYLVAARQLAEGGELYRDIGDVNQPSIYWLHLGLRAIAGLLGIADRALVPLALLALSLASLQLSWRLLRPLAGAAAAGFLLGASWASGLLALDVQGEREQWMLVALWPWVALAALRLAGAAAPRGACVATGLLAGAAVTLKLPFFALPLLLLEALLLWRGRWRPLRPELLAAAGIAALLLLLQGLLHPAYLERVLPEALRYYTALDHPLGPLLMRRGILLPAILLLLAVALLPWARPMPAAHALAQAGLAAAGGFALAFLLQGKGFGYHWMPVLGCGTAAVAALLPALLAARRPLPLAAAAALLLLPAWCLYLGWQQVRAAPTAWADARAFAAELERRAEVAERPPTVYALGPELYPLFPAVAVAGARWAMAESHLWQLDGLYRLEPEPAGFRPPARQGAEEAALRRRLVGRFLASRPDLVAVFDGEEATLGGSPFDYLDYLLADPDFAAAWGAYRPAGRIGDYRLYERGRPE